MTLHLKFLKKLSNKPPIVGKYINNIPVIFVADMNFSYCLKFKGLYFLTKDLQTEERIATKSSSKLFDN